MTGGMPGRIATHAALPRDLRRALLVGLLVAVAAGAGLWFIGSLRHALPAAILVVVLLGTVVTVIFWLMGRVGEDVEQPYWVSTPREESVAPDVLDYRLMRLRRDLRDALERDDRPDEIYPVIRELAAERLLAEHDIHLDAQPEAARAVLDEQLWSYLSTPPTDTRKRSKSALHTAIEGIEKL